MTENEKYERQYRSKLIAGMEGVAARFSDLASKLHYSIEDVSVEDIKGACDMAGIVRYWAEYWGRALAALATPPPAEPVANDPISRESNGVSEVEDPF